MNSYNGSVVANAAIVPAGSAGAIDIYVTDLSDVLMILTDTSRPKRQAAGLCAIIDL